MFPILVLLFICIPVIEIALIIQVGSVLGVWTTVALILFTAIVGASLVRSQGLQTLLSAQQRMQQGELPAEQLIEGVMIAVAGMLLLTPGFFTDTLGLLLLLPWIRHFLIKRYKSKLVFNGSNAYHQRGFGQSAKDDRTFEGEYERKNDDQDKLN